MRPLGALVVKPTVPVNPPEGVTLIVLVPEELSVRDRVVGDADKEKLGEVEPLPNAVRPRSVPMPLAKSQQAVAG